jgi:hypothetical protein
LELEARVKEKILLMYLTEYLKDPAEADNVRVDPKIYRELAVIVTKSVQTRLLLEDLSRLPSVSYIEYYRLFSASQQAMKFQSMPEIINAIILYGDILPDWKGLELHPMTRSLFSDITTECIPFFSRLPHIKPEMIVEFGAQWVRAVCLCLVKYLPEPDNDNWQNASKEYKSLNDLLNQKSLQDRRYRFKNEAEQWLENNKIAPLNEPRPPSLFRPQNIIFQVTEALINKALIKEEKKIPTKNPFDKSKDMNKMASFIRAVRSIEKAGSQQRNWEDMRSDILESALQVSCFREGPIQGNPTDGHVVNLQLGGGMGATGEIFDRAIELSDDLPAYEKLLAESKPITDLLRRTLYPSIEQVPEIERFRTSGSIDPARLAMADLSPAIFRRYRINEKADRRGRPTLLIACDASGSLNKVQIKMLKVLTAAWLNSTVKSGVQVIAGLYHSGDIRPGLSGPLIQWIYYPKKTPSNSRRDAARALLSLPKSGTGSQSDALSLAFMLDEARQIARGKMVYLIIITDCKWNQSFRTGKSGRQEVYSFFRKAYKESFDKLHITFVALGVSGKTGFEEMLDRIINVSDEQLNDYDAVAAEIGVYVASCIKERQKWIARR